MKQCSFRTQIHSIWFNRRLLSSFGDITSERSSLYIHFLRAQCEKQILHDTEANIRINPAWWRKNLLLQRKRMTSLFGGNYLLIAKLMKYCNIFGVHAVDFFSPLP